jgi:hypothetical protein
VVEPACAISRDADSVGELARDGVLCLSDADGERAPEGLSSSQLHLLAGNERELREVTQELVVVVRDSADRSLLAGLEARERAQARPVDAEIGVGDRIAMGVMRRIPERAVDARLDLLGESVLEAVGLRMHRVEAEPERLREVLLEEPVVADHLERDPLS